MTSTSSNIEVLKGISGELTDVIKSNSIAYQTCGVQPSDSRAPLVFGIKKGDSDLSFEIVHKTPTNVFATGSTPSTDSFTEEMIDDVYSIFGEESTEILKNIAANNIIDELDNTIVDHMYDLSHKASSEILDMYDYSVEENVYRLLLKINQERVIMAKSLKRGLPKTLIVSPGIATLLITNKILSGNDSDFISGSQDNIKLIGSIGDMKIFMMDQDTLVNIDTEFVIISHKSDIPGDASIILIPIQEPKPSIRRDNESGQLTIHYTQKYAYSQNPLDINGSDNSNFITSIDVGYEIYSLFLRVVEGALTQTEQVSKTLITDTSAGPITQINPNTGLLETTAAEVPLVVYDKGLTSLGAYTCLNGMTNDISDAYWGKATADTDAPNEFQATAQYGRIISYIPTVTGVVYVISYYAYVEPGGTLTRYRIKHNNSASGNDEAVTLTEIRTRYHTKILGNALSGTVGFGIQDNNTSNWSKVYIDTINVTQSPVALPEVVNNTTSPVTVSTRSGTSSFDLTTMPKTVDRLDGEADGVDLFSGLDYSDFTPSSSIVTGGVDGEIICEATASTFFGVNKSGLQEIGKYYDVEFEAKSSANQSWGFTGVVNTGDLGNEASNPNLVTVYQKYRFRVIATSTAYKWYANTQSIGDVMTLKNYKMKAVSPAQGQAHGTFVPWVSAADTDNNTYLNVLATNSIVNSLLFLRVDAGGTPSVRADDGPNAMIATHNWLANTEYEYDLFWGWHNATAKNAMQLRVRAVGATTWIESSVTDFVGRWPISSENELVFGYGAGDYPISTGELTIKELDQIGWSKVHHDN